MTRGLAAAVAVVVTTAVLSGCRPSSREPRSVAGVLATYTAIGADAVSGNYSDLCRHYLDEALLDQLAVEHRLCPLFLSEHWGEFTPASKVSPKTHVAVSGNSAIVYDGRPPEVLKYEGGEWRLTRIPRSGEHGTSFIRKLNREAEAINAAANASSHR